MPWEKAFDVDETLEKAMQAFWRRGYESTSMQDVVDCTGVNRASLYATYGDKRALFLAALRRYDDTKRRRLLARLDGSDDPAAAVRALFEAFTADAGANDGCFMTNTALELAPHDEEIRAIVARGQREIEDFFERSVRRGITLGQFVPRLDARRAARGLLASFLGVVVLCRSRPEKALLRGIVDVAVARLT